MKTATLTLLLTLLFFSCKKEAPIPEENKQLAVAFTLNICCNQYRLVSYVSEQPIDYAPEDSVGAKTNHWEYVSFYLKDDAIQFNGDGTVVINQNANQMPGTNGPIIRNWKITPDHEGVQFDFVNFTYDPLSYRIVSVSDTGFVVKAKWNGNEVISTFKAL